ncbi:MAG: YeeE/YedE family protein, partial [Deltaproteobacteria bacterium]|nr:YeeE/YedE family protein [Deltaproteobacteria bacterium]
ANLLLIGALLGVTLYHAAFGFTSAYRRMLLHRDVTGVRAQLLMLAIATLLFAPVLASGSMFGRGVVGAVAPVGWQVAIGAFMFGIGMQLGGGCGSGTLYALGGGSLRLLFTLAAFIAGSFWASLHMSWWQALPSWPAMALGHVLGWPLAVLAQLGFIAVLWVMAGRWGKTFPDGGLRNHGKWHVLLRGPWPLLCGAAALAVLNFVTLIVAGHPWSVTWAFTLWGAKIASTFGWNPESSLFWSGGFQEHALQTSIFEDTVSLMNFGILLGAMCGAALAGRYAPRWGSPARSYVAGLLGGLAMGYGARIAFGCNIGAFFSGVASTSLHGWIWIAAALPGTWIGVKLRPYFGQEN